MTWIWTGIIILAVMMLMTAGIASYRENRKLAIEEYTVVSPKIPEAFDGSRIVFLSDLHGRRFGYKNQELLKKIRECRPDFILAGGDMTVSDENGNEETAISLMEELAREYNVYSANGNHEMRLMRKEEIYGLRYKEYIHELKECGVRHMSNETIIVEAERGCISLTAYDLEQEYYHRFRVPQMKKEDIDRAVGECSGEGFQILLAHNPNYFSAYEAWGSDLTLAGHFHGGMVRIPGIGGVISPQFQLFPKYDAGKFEKNNRTMIVSRGLGNHSIKLRLWNQPEISCIILKKQRK